MHNFCKNIEEIKIAADAGIVTKEDFNTYMGALGYKDSIKKARENSRISDSVFIAETAKTESLYFERDYSNRSVLRFKLHGADFQPLDLREPQEITKAKEEEPLQKASSTHSQTIIKGKEDSSLSKLQASVEGIVKMAAEMNSNWKKGTAGKK